jgi:regulator of protease activity HflC (stomatin/prohibitin superfamily)
MSMRYPDDDVPNPFTQFAPRLVGGIILIVVLLVVLSSSTHIVPPGARGVLVTLGQPSPAFRPEGLTFKIPFAQQVINVSVRQVTQQGRASSFTADLQNVDVLYDVLYRLPEGKVVELYQNFSGSVYDSLLLPRIQETIKQVSAQYRAEDLVKNREVIKTETIERLRTALDGLVIINDLTVTNIDLTDELEKAIEQKTIAEQQSLKKNFELDIATKDAEIKRVTAKGEADAIRLQGEALRSAPDVVQLEIIRKWDGKAPTTVVTDKGGANVLLPIAR